ncbi:MAG: carotenoid biosynthesis protein [Proteobacteria bacterium]|nr:carotenoid biosynthesis protein [Pseudomonadota bacterium]
MLALSFEAVVVVLFVAAFALALRSGDRPRALRLPLAAAFGWLVEMGFLALPSSAYHYEGFSMYLPGGVPVGVLLGWSVILYVSEEVAARRSTSMASTTALTALVALSFDLGLEPIARAGGLWHWNTETPYHSAYLLGIPVDNFVGWAVISGSWVALRSRGTTSVKPILRRLLLSVVAVFVTYAVLITPIYLLLGQIWGTAVIFAATLALFGTAATPPRATTTRFDAIAMVSMYAWIALAGIGSGASADPAFWGVALVPMTWGLLAASPLSLRQASEPALVTAEGSVVPAEPRPGGPTC